mmetsp:Transcript_27394/g.37938  ORF Transcript_27394/g.37938 Transcript_27394/m.37938 type:complete len:420 (+) Transcript_27394:1-1260(+)
MDNDNDNRMTLKEFRRGLIQSGLSREEVPDSISLSMWRRMDSDRSGYISFKEFKVAFARIIGVRHRRHYHPRKAPNQAESSSIPPQGDAGDGKEHLLAQSAPGWGLSRPFSNEAKHEEQKKTAGKPESAHISVGPELDEPSLTKEIKTMVMERWSTLIAAWRVMDKDNNNVMTFGEFCRGLRASGISEALFPVALAKSLWKQMDLDTSGDINFKEFKKTFSTLLRDHRGDAIRDKQGELLSSSSALKGNGSISSDNIAKYAAVAANRTTGAADEANDSKHEAALNNDNTENAYMRRNLQESAGFNIGSRPPSAFKRGEDNRSSGDWLYDDTVGMVDAATNTNSYLSHSVRSMQIQQTRGSQEASEEPLTESSSSSPYGVLPPRNSQRPDGSAAQQHALSYIRSNASSIVQNVFKDPRSN